MGFYSFYFTWLIPKRSLNVFSWAYSYNILRNALLYFCRSFWSQCCCLLIFNSSIFFIVREIWIIQDGILNIGMKIICIKSSCSWTVTHYLFLFLCFIRVRKFLNFWICAYSLIIAAVGHAFFCSKT